MKQKNVRYIYYWNNNIFIGIYQEFGFIYLILVKLSYLDVN